MYISSSFAQLNFKSRAGLLYTGKYTCRVCNIVGFKITVFQVLDPRKGARINLLNIIHCVDLNKHFSFSFEINSNYCLVANIYLPLLEIQGSIERCQENAPVMQFSGNNSNFCI